MNINFFDKMDKKSILSTYVNIINRQLTGLNMIPSILYILNLIIVFMEEGKSDLIQDLEDTISNRVNSREEVVERSWPPR
jgi:hypothetical protein